MEAPPGAARRHDHFDPVRAAFAAACRALAPLRRGAALLLGCSAGGDSMALLDLTAREASRRRWRLTVAHFDHAQRTESAAEAAFVADQCRTRGIPILTERLAAGNETTTPLSEGAMRLARHEFFRRAAAQTGSEALLLAHQADDRAETFLMRLMQGAGPTGLAAIRAEDIVGGLRVVRPLLGAGRAELRDYLAARGLEWRDDPSNADERQKRAWVRASVIPLLEGREGGGTSRRIARAAALIGEEAEALDEACAMLLEQITESNNPAIPQNPTHSPPSSNQSIASMQSISSIASMQSILSTPPSPAPPRLNLRHPVWRRAGAGLRRRLIRAWLWRLVPGPHPPGFEAASEALRFAERAANGSELRTVSATRIIKTDGCLLARPGGATDTPEAGDPKP